MSVQRRALWVNGALCLLALAALLAALVTRKLPSRAELELRQHNVLPVFREAEIQRIEVQRGAERAVLARGEPEADVSQAGPEGSEALVAPAPWRLLEPLETVADTAAVDKLLGTLRYATWLRRLDAAEAPAQATFDATSLLIELTMGERVYRLRLGGDSPSPPGSKYLELSGSAARPELLVIKGSLAQELDRSPAVFRGRQIAPYSRRSIQALTLSGAGGERRLERLGEGFRFRGMQGDLRVERGAVDRLFLALARSDAEPFLSLEQAESALARAPGVELTLVPLAAGKPEAKLSIGGRCPGRERAVVALRRVPEALAGCVDASVLDALSVPAEALVDRGLFSLNLDELEHLRIVEGERRLELARKGEGYVLQAPREAELDSAAANDRLTRLLALRGELLLPPPPALPEGAIALELSAEPASALPDARASQTIFVSAPGADGSVRAFRQADGATLLLSAEQRLLLGADTSLLKPLAVFGYSAHQVKQVHVQVGALSQRLSRSDAGELRLLEPAGFELDGGLALDLIDRLRALTALRWVTDRASDGFGLSAPRATVQLVLDVEGRELTRTLTLGQRTAGGVYASVDRDPGVFVAPRALERTLGTWLLDRSLFAVRRAEIQRITLTVAQRGRLLVERVGSELRWAGEVAGFDPALLEELLDALETLRPEAAVHLGAARAGEGLERPLLVCRVERAAAGAPASAAQSFSVGSRDSFEGSSIYYASSSAADAVYALPRVQVQRLLDLFL